MVEKDFEKAKHVLRRSVRRKRETKEIKEQSVKDIVKELMKELGKEEKQEEAQAAKKEEEPEKDQNVLLDIQKTADTIFESKVRAPVLLGEQRARNLEDTVIRARPAQEAEPENGKRDERRRPYDDKKVGYDTKSDTLTARARTTEYISQEGRQVNPRVMDIIEQAQRDREIRTMPAAIVPEHYRAAYEAKERDKEKGRLHYQSAREVIKKDVSEMIKGKKAEYTPRATSED